jgi:hypothetical protein
VSIEETVGISSTQSVLVSFPFTILQVQKGLRPGFYTFATHIHFPAFLQDASCGTPAPKARLRRRLSCPGHSQARKREVLLSVDAGLQTQMVTFSISVQRCYGLQTESHLQYRRRELSRRLGYSALRIEELVASDPLEMLTSGFYEVANLCPTESM